MLSKWLLVALLALVQNIYADDSDALDPSTAGFEAPKCEGSVCNMCMGVNIQKPLKFDHKICAKISYKPEDLAIELKCLFNEKEIYSKILSAKDLTKIAIPLPIPSTFMEIVFYDIKTVGKNINCCATVKINWLKLWTLGSWNVGCMKMGTDGVKWFKPNTVVVNGPEIYDQVNFELDVVAFPSITVSMTPEEENNIGQLKL